nr:PREDICTED: tetratricopeptide repeat protein 1 isoform X2 [Lepisosteus oculatus]
MAECPSDRDRLPEALARTLDLSERHSGPEPEDECFFDCEETLQGEAEEGQRRGEAGEAGQPGAAGRERALWEESTEAKDRAVEGREEEEEEEEEDEEEEERNEDAARGRAGQSRAERGQGDGEGAERWEECLEGAEARGEEEEEEDLELKPEEAPEFDEEHLRELEKDLTEEEKESRRDEGMKLKERGNEQFKKGEHSEAEESYTAALRICPVCYSKERSILFSNRAAACLKLDKKEKAISDCTKAIDLNPNYVRAILRRAELYEKTDKLDEALEDYKAVLEKDPTVHQAREACMRLPEQITERNEKLKEEMMGKLKDLGNLFLRPFGLSTENFQVQQDPASGSYSINFVQNPNNNR